MAQDSKKLDFLKHHKLVFYLINLILLIPSFVIPFLMGSMTEDNRIESIARYGSNQAVANTVSHELGISLSPTEDSGELMNDEREFRRLYGVFKQTHATFGSAYNIDKSHSILLSEVDKSLNLSVFYSGIDSSVPYDDHFKHAYYPFEFMFETKRMYDIARYMIYFTETQADTFLLNKGFKKGENGYTKKDYESLIGLITTVNVDGVDYDCVISNIILESNYYYKEFKELLSDYIICAYYFPGQLVRHNIYIFREYEYQNKYFMEYINANYGNKLYKVDVIKNNVTDAFDYDYLLSFYYGDVVKNNTTWYFLFVLAILMISSSSLMYMFRKIRVCDFFFVGLLPLFVYLIFTLVGISTMDYLSDSGIRLFLLLFLYYIVSLLLLKGLNHLINKRNRCLEQ